jgi:hypothetical protein
MQQLTVDYKLRKYRPYIMHIPNGGKRSAATGAKLKTMGVMKGVADYEVLKPIPSKDQGIVKGGINLYLEFKHGNNKQSPEQKKFEEMVISCGHLYKVVWSVDDAIAEISKYFNN